MKSSHTNAFDNWKKRFYKLNKQVVKSYGNYFGYEESYILPQGVG